VSNFKNVPSEYELRAIREIHEWKNPKLNWFDKAMEIVNTPIEKIGNVIPDVPDIPAIEQIFEKTIGGLINILNDFAHWTVRPEAICEEFRKAGYKNVCNPADILELDLHDVDRVIGYLGAKYKSLASIEGAAAGFAGLPGIPPDVLAIISLNQRAIGEYATYCGFDVSTQQERLFALNVLAFSSSPSDASKQIAMAQLVRIAQDVAKKKGWKDLEKHIFVKIVQIIAKNLGIRLTKAKLAQIVPIAGVVVGGGFNAYYTNKVCNAAFFLYRERFLASKYGADIIEVTVKPAEILVPEYDDQL
jgi:hypothetical protein